MKKRLKFVVLSTFILAGISFFCAHERISVKAADPILDEISSYRNWKNVTKEPIKVHPAEELTDISVKPSGFTIDGAPGGG